MGRGKAYAVVAQRHQAFSHSSLGVPVANGEEACEQDYEAQEDGPLDDLAGLSIGASSLVSDPTWTDRQS